MQGEQGSVDIIAACEFQNDFEKVLAEYYTEQIFNCDETGLQYRLLPRKTLVRKELKEGKKCKDRITICACANVTGTIKLPLLFIGKAAKPHCFTRYELNNLPVVYKSQKNAWVNCNIFSAWFHDSFVPFVQDELRNIGQQPKALLLMDNCSAHPDEELLISRDGLVKAMFLPPNVTSLIQPMDQGVLEALKHRYRKSLLRDILISDGEVDITEFLKQVNMKAVIEKVALSWDQITSVTIRRSWRKLIPIAAPAEGSTSSSPNNHPECSPSSEDGSGNQIIPVAEFVSEFGRLGLELTEEDVSEWIEADCNDTGYEHLDDDGIVSYVLTQSDTCSSSLPDESVESDDEELSTVAVVSHRDAMEMLDKCLTWLHAQPEATSYNTSVLLSLKELAANKRWSALKQTTLTSYFS